MNNEPQKPPAKTIHYPTEGFALDIDKDHIRIRTTDYHADSLVLFWQELLDLAKGVGFDIPRGSPQTFGAKRELTGLEVPKPPKEPTAH